MGIDICNAQGYHDLTAYHALSSIRREEKRLEQYKQLVFISSPFAGDVGKNIKNAQKYSRFAIERGVIPFAPHLLFPQFLDDDDASERSLGIHFGLRFLAKCSEMWVFGLTITPGMRRELNEAHRLRIKVRHFYDSGREVTKCKNSRL